MHSLTTGSTFILERCFQRHKPHTTLLTDIEVDMTKSTKPTGQKRTIKLHAMQCLSPNATNTARYTIRMAMTSSLYFDSEALKF
jgi:hypothetical protein